MKAIRFILLGALLLLFQSSRCFSADNELETLRGVLFKADATPTELPVSADPPTGDYTDLANGKISFRIDDGQIRQLARFRNELEPLIVERIGSDYCWMYLSAFLRYESAVPIIKKKLIGCESIYGWEGPDYSKIETWLVDAQYPYQMACINAIEYITHKPVGQSISLTKKERSDLIARAKKCRTKNIDKADFMRYCSAYWLLGKLKIPCKNAR